VLRNPVSHAITYGQQLQIGRSRTCTRDAFTHQNQNSEFYYHSKSRHILEMEMPPAINMLYQLSLYISQVTIGTDYKKKGHAAYTMLMSS
jgi:hypothetical protein